MVLFSDNNDEAARSSFGSLDNLKWLRNHFKKFFYFLPGEVLPTLFSAAQDHFNLHLGILFQEFLSLTRLKFQIVLADSKGQPDAFHFIRSLFGALFPLFLLFLIQEFAKVRNFNYWRLKRGNNLYQIQVLFLGQGQGLFNGQNAQIFSFVVNHPDFSGSYVVVDIVPFKNELLLIAST